MAAGGALVNAFWQAAHFCHAVGNFLAQQHAAAPGFCSLANHHFHGVGRVDMVENRFVGMKSRGVYETPGGTILHFAHRQIESLTMDREVMNLRDSLVPRYATLVYNGFWYAPERLALQALITESQRNVTGTVRVKLYKGSVYVAGRKSPCSLYNPHIATMEADPTKAYNQDDATGFIRLNGLRLRVNSKVNGVANLSKTVR